MKRLLLLLFFSASLFASAQTLTLIELTSTASDGRGIFGPSAMHAIQGDNTERFMYDGYTTSITSYTLDANGEFTTPLNVYSSVGNFEQDARQFIYGLGDNGRFYNSSEEELLNVGLSSYLVEDVYAPLTAPGTEWVRGEGDLSSGFTREVCEYTFITQQAGSNGFTLTGIASGTLITVDRPGGPQSASSIIFWASRDFPALVDRGFYFPTAQHVVDAVNLFLETNGCHTCVDASASLNDLNEIFVLAGFESGLNDWARDNEDGTHDFVRRRDGSFQAYNNVPGETNENAVDASGNFIYKIPGNFPCVDDAINSL